VNNPLSDIDISAEIIRISGLLDHQVTELARRARAAAQARVDYELAHAKALIVAEGANAPEREARALLACADLYAAHKAADAVLLAAQEAGRSLRAQADSLRSLSASQRAALTYSEGIGS
jgi:predicted phosphoribosyltransferase